MPNEITAEELAREMALIAEGDGSPSDGFYAQFLLATRAHAALMAERQAPRTFDKTEERDFAKAPKPAVERVRCWAIEDKATGRILEVHTTFRSFSPNMPYRAVEGWFTPDTGDAG